MKQRNADLLMMLVTLSWGSSYLFMKNGLNSVSPFNLVALRFFLAFILCGAVWFKRLRLADKRTLGYSLVLGFLLFAVSASVIFGLRSTSTSHAGFLASLTVIFVPALSVVVLNQKPGARLITGACVTMTGIGLLTLSGPMSVKPGDLLCILAALLYAVHILVTGAAAKVADPLNLGILQLGFAGGLGLLFSFLFESPQVPVSLEGWISVLMLSVVCSAAGYIIQSIAQKYTTPTHTGLIFALEPVFAAAFAYVFADEHLSVRGYIGAALILSGLFIAEMKRGRTSPKGMESATTSKPPGMAFKSAKN
ncbi:DMT family transporter [Paenibacillus sp. 7124]|uniref:DMT family transporter n=1 Tax=Paenibacillus apii TaxID=1850370 RepID=A0A6M1PJ42_9BACL|nr:DMT family transporter [Paenibacillus apii]NGM82355.1 DMT family transporter [Paenibacillus apii]NJJ39491.1 DMT family transporter [Paenibacillus apii]